jgi:hypothetical protein
VRFSHSAKKVISFSRRVRREAPLVARRCQRKWPSMVYSEIEVGIASRLGQLSEEVA